jgi:hypothetical protein
LSTGKECGVTVAVLIWAQAAERGLDSDVEQSCDAGAFVGGQCILTRTCIVRVQAITVQQIPGPALKARSQIEAKDR